MLFGLHRGYGFIFPVCVLYSLSLPVKIPNNIYCNILNQITKRRIRSKVQCKINTKTELFYEFVNEMQSYVISLEGRCNHTLSPLKGDALMRYLPWREMQSYVISLEGRCNHTLSPLKGDAIIRITIRLLHIAYKLKKTTAS